MFYRVNDVETIFGIKHSKAYEIIRNLQKSLVAEGYVAPPAGRIQKRYFCKKYNLDLADCEALLKKGAA